MRNGVLKVAGIRVHVMLFGMLSAILLAFMLLLAVPADAQENDGDVTNTQYGSPEDSQQRAQADENEDDDSRATTRAAVTLGRETAQITEIESADDPDIIVDRIVVSAADCEVNPDAVVVVEDDDGTRVRLTNNQNATITATEDQVTIVGTDTGGNLTELNPIGGDNQFGTGKDTVVGEVVSASGITCGRDDGDGEGSDFKAADGDNFDGVVDNLLDLECDALLRRFRSVEQGQYGAPAAFATVEVSDRIVVCLKQEVIQGTASDENLPDTGGLPLLGLAALGLVSAVAGVSVIRGTRRGE